MPYRPGVGSMLFVWSRRGSGCSRVWAQLGGLCVAVLAIGVVGLVAVTPSALGRGIVYVKFRVDSTGTGTATISRPSVDCGVPCIAELEYGKKVSLVAHPDRGSHFVRWENACSAEPTCELEVGPVTRVTAVFDLDSPPRASSPDRPPDRTSPDKPSDRTSPDKPSDRTSPDEPSGGGSSDRPPAVSRRFVANLSRVTVRGRLVVFRVHVNGAAVVRARLTRGQRNVAGGRWPIAPGSRVLRWEIARRVGWGNFRMIIKVRRVGGPSERFIRAIRLAR